MTSPSLKPEDIDKVGLTVLYLAQELWTMMERQKLLEHALAEQGLAVSKIIDDHTPGDTLDDELASERRRFIDRIVTTLSSEPGVTA